jgi:phosphate transport system permease protein
LPRSRSRSESGFRIGTGFFGLILVGIICAIGVVLTVESIASIRRFGWDFWRTDLWDPVAGEFGALPFIWGTLYSAVLALGIATPIALGIAIFISELSPAAFRQPLVFLTELLAAIPSIVYGLWGIFVLVPAVRALESATPEALRGSPLFSGPPLGLGMLAAGLVLAVMVMPFISSVSREVLKSVPVGQREGAYALGATRFEAIRAVLFYARTGIIGAIMLGFGRALGETMAVTMVIGNRPEISLSLFEPSYTIASAIANEFTEATGDLYLSALVELGLILFLVTFVVNGIARVLVWNVTRKTGGVGRAA